MFIPFKKSLCFVKWSFYLIWLAYVYPNSSPSSTKNNTPYNQTPHSNASLSPRGYSAALKSFSFDALCPEGRC